MKSEIESTPSVFRHREPTLSENVAYIRSVRRYFFIEALKPWALFLAVSMEWSVIAGILYPEFLDRAYILALYGASAGSMMMCVCQLAEILYWRRLEYSKPSARVSPPTY